MWRAVGCDPVRRKKLIIIAAVVVGLPVLLLATVALYLSAADLGAYRPTVERVLTDALGQEVRIAGEFEPRIALTSTVVAGDVRLANPDGSTAPEMVAVDRLSVKLDLLSFLFRPLRIEEIKARGVRVFLEADAEGRANWEFETQGGGDGGESAPPGLVVGRVLIEGAELVYRDPSMERPLSLTVAHLEIVSDESGMLDLQLDGGLNGATLVLAGRLGPQAGLLAAGAVEGDLTGQLGDTEFVFRGRTESLATLSGTDLDLSAQGPDLVAFTGLLGLPHLGDGPFRVAAKSSPAGEGFDLSLDVSAGEIRADARGRVDSLLRPRRLAVTVEASGPDAAAVGALVAIDALPAESFSVSGRVRWEGFPITFEEVELRVGENRLSAGGVLGPPPLMPGTDFRFEGAGPDAAALGALARLELPAEPFEIRGRLTRQESGIAAEKIEARIGSASLEVDGILGDPPGYSGSDLRVRASAPDLSRFGGLARRLLPAESFEVEGRLERNEQGLGLRGGRARLGEHALQIEGRFGLANGLAGTDLRLLAEGPDLSLPAGLAGLPDLPPEPYRVEGGLRIQADGYRLREVTGTVGDRSLWIDGRIGPEAGLIGTDLRLRLEGEDLSRTAPLLGLDDAPALPYRTAGRLRIKEGAYLVDGLTGFLGDVELEAEGRVGADPGLDGTDLRLSVRGLRASALHPWIGRSVLPDDPFELSGAVSIEEGLYLLDHVVADLGPDRLILTGPLAPVRDLVGSELDLELTGLSLARLGRLASGAGLGTLPELPDEAYSAKGRVKVHADGYELHSVRLELGPASVRLEGRLGSPPSFAGSDLTFDGDGPDAALFLALTGVTAPAMSFQCRGRVELPGAGFRFHELSVRLGDYSGWMDGVLGEPPDLEGTDLDLRAEGPSLDLIQQLSGLPELPDEPFELSAHFQGTPSAFSMDRLAVRVGQSDLAGSLRADLRGKPVVRGELRSRRLDLATLLGEREPAVEPASPAEPSERRRLLSDEPFDTKLLRAANGDLRWSIGSVDLHELQFADVRIDATLRDGHLRLDPIVAVGRHGGRLEAFLSLRSEEAGVRVESRVDLDDARLDLSAAETDPTQWPLLDVDFDLAGSGSSPHGLAAAATGRIALVAGEGAVDRSILDSLATPVFRSLHDAFLPFSKENPSSRLGCAVVVMSLDNGRVTLDPLVAQTDRMTMLASGRVNLQTEEIDLDWVIKQRRGIGISASTFTNPYIKLGGTLSEPSVEVKPLRAATATGAAVATGGLSLLGKGFWDRITSERKVCKRALKVVD